MDLKEGDEVEIDIAPRVLKKHAYPQDVVWKATYQPYLGATTRVGTCGYGIQLDPKICRWRRSRDAAFQRWVREYEGRS